jgi:hypothetical protein
MKEEVNPQQITLGLNVQGPSLCLTRILPNVVKDSGHKQTMFGFHRYDRKTHIKQDVLTTLVQSDVETRIRGNY